MFSFQKTFFSSIKTLLFLGLLCLSFLATPVVANDKYASLVMDAETGVILHQRYADKMLHPASLTKVMTLLMVFDALDSGKLKLNDRIYVSKNAASMVPSKLDLPPGSSISVRDAIFSLVTKSANDIAVAIAEKLGKTEQRFAVMMTKKARSLGMNRTRFINASGLHHPKQVTTARDMAKMGRYLIEIQPRYYPFFKTQNFTYRGKSYRNHNRLLGSYDGLDGIKTGYIQASGFNLLASAKRGDKRIIGVVFGGRTSKSRNAHMVEILDAGFKKITDVRVAAPMLPTRNPRREAMVQMASAARTNMNTSQLAQNLLAAEEKQIQKTSISATPVQTNKDRTDHYKVTRYEIAQKTVEAHMQMLSYREAYSSEAAQQEAAVKKFLQPPQGLQNASYTTKHDRRWSIQIGAYSDRDATDMVLQKARQKLPSSLQYAQPFIAPFEGRQGWIYRAWLSGFTQRDAQAACVYYKDCLVVSPKAN